MMSDDPKPTTRITVLPHTDLCPEGLAFDAKRGRKLVDALDEAWGLDAQSRLSCCVRVAGEQLTVELPRYTKNLAREH